MIHCLFCVIALSIFIVQTGTAMCKYGYRYYTSMSSYWVCVQGKEDRQLTGQDSRLILRTERLLRAERILWKLRTNLQQGKRGRVLKKKQLQEILVMMTLQWFTSINCIPTLPALPCLMLFGYSVHAFIVIIMHNINIKITQNCLWQFQVCVTKLLWRGFNSISLSLCPNQTYTNKLLLLADIMCQPIRVSPTNRFGLVINIKMYQSYPPKGSVNRISHQTSTQILRLLAEILCQSTRESSTNVFGLVINLKIYLSYPPKQGMLKYIAATENVLLLLSSWTNAFRLDGLYLGSCRCKLIKAW